MKLFVFFLRYVHKTNSFEVGRNKKVLFFTGPILLLFNRIILARNLLIDSFCLLVQNIDIQYFMCSIIYIDISLTLRQAQDL